MWWPVCKGLSDKEMGAAPGSEGFISNLRYRMSQKKKPIGHSDIIRIFLLADGEMQDMCNINTDRLPERLRVSNNRLKEVEPLRNGNSWVKSLI